MKPIEQSAQSAWQVVRLLPLSILALIPATATPAMAATYTVSNQYDVKGSILSPNTLRGAFAACEADGDTNDTINITAVGTITLTQGQLQLINPRNIPGKTITIVEIPSPGTAALTISGNHSDRMFYFGNLSVIINGLNLTQGNAPGNGGCILADKATTITLYNTNISDSFSAAAGSGGAIASTGDLFLYNCTFKNNGALKGGAIYSSGGSLDLNDCTLSGNGTIDARFDQATASGGAIYSENETAVFNSSTLSANKAGNGQGGGIYCSRDIATVIDCNIAGNSAGKGGGISLNSPTSQPLFTTSIRASAIYNNIVSLPNSGGDGAGIYNSGTLLDLSNSTVASNDTDSQTSAAAGHGGGIYNNGVLTLKDCTIASNHSAGIGAGLYNLSSVPSVTSTVLAGNTSGNIANTGSIVSGGSNVIGDPDGNGFTNDPDHANPASRGNHDQTNVVSPRLNPIADNGGLTWTMTPQAGSPVIDGDFADATVSDQRGTLLGQRNDVGARELFSTPLPKYYGNFFVTNTGESGAGSLRATIALVSGILGGGDIYFDTTIFGPGKPRTIPLSHGALSIPSSMQILGPGAQWLTIDARQASRVFDIDSPSFVHIQGLTIEGGNALSYSADPLLDAGGGILQRSEGSTLFLENCVIAHNTASYGGGMYLRNAIVNSTQVLQNTATLGGGGIAVHCDFPTLQFHGLTTDYLDVSGNHTSGNGGGILLDHALGNVFTTTLSDNEAQRGGGLESNYGFSLSESTISGNRAVIAGGGIDAAGKMNTRYTTIANNQSPDIGGLFATATQADISTTIIAANTSGNVSVASGTVTSTLGSNLIGDPDGNGFVNDPNHADPNSKGDHTQTGVADPLLGPLKNNGGLTPTMALLPGSPAIDADFDTVFYGESIDQRASSRPVGVRRDVGAYETGAPYAIDDVYTINMDSSLTIPSPGVLVNDIQGYPGEILNVVATVQPNHGTLTLASDGSFKYVPDTGFSGTDSFTYQINSEVSFTHPGVVTINVAHAPITVATTTPASPNGSHGYYTVPVQVVLTAIANDSPIEKTTFKLDLASPRVYSRPFTVSGDGEHTIQYGSTSNLGVAETPKTLTIKIDGTKPVTTASTESAGTAERVTLTAVDNFSGVAGTVYRVDAGSPQTYIGPFQVASSVRHTIVFHSVDTAGNVEDSHTFTIGQPGIAHTYAPGLQMLSAPADYSNIPLSSALSITIPILAQWLPGSGQYAVTPTAPADTLRPGHGYWARFTVPADLYDIGVSTPTATPFSIPLSAGWNMIGDPFPASIPVGAMAVVDNASVERTMTAAIAAKLIAPTLYSYPAGATQYQTVSANDSLAPYLGYWIYATQPTTLKIAQP